MRAGQLDRLVTVQKRTIVKGTSGEEVEAWADERTLWMVKRDVRASERIAGNGELSAEIDTVFRTWFPERFSIAPDTHRLVYRGRVYQVHGVPELGRRKAIEIFCSARGEARYGNFT